MKGGRGKVQTTRGVGGTRENDNEEGETDADQEKGNDENNDDAGITNHDQGYPTLA